MNKLFKIKVKWKNISLQILSSLIMGLMFGMYHFILSNNDFKILSYYTFLSFLLSMGLWQGVAVVHAITEKYFSWAEDLFKRLLWSLLLSFVLTYLMVFIVDFIFPFIFDPLFNTSIVNQEGQPQLSLAVFFLDGTISLFIFLFYLTLVNLIGYFSDIQEKRIKNAEKNVESYFSSLIEDIHDVIQVIDSDGKKLYCSSSIQKLTGYTVEEVLNLKLGFELVHPADRNFILNEFKQNIARNFDTYTTQCRTITRDGQVKYIESKFTNASQNPLLKGYIVVMSDVTERVKAEARSRHQREMYQLLTEVSAEFLSSDIAGSVKLMLEKIGRFAKVDRAYVFTLDEEAMHWLCLNEWRSVGVEDIQSNYSQDGFPVSQSKWLFEQMKNNKLLNYEDVNTIPEAGSDFKAICNNDSTKSVLLFPMSRNGKLYGFMGFDSVLEKKIWDPIDIAALQICSEMTVSAMLRDRAEKTLQRSLSVNKAILDSTSEGILLTDLHDNMLYFNNNFKDMWMFSDEDLKERKKSKALEKAIEHVINAEEVYQIISNSEEDVEKELRLVAHLKNDRILEGISLPQIIDGRVVGRVWSNRDITERVHAEREEMEKSFALAQFESLKNQVNPHFLFNSLNVLSSLVHIDANLSEKFIDQLARSYRYLLEQRDNELVLLKTEIDFVNSFTFLLKIRFEEKLKVRINLDASVMSMYIAPLTLQLLIENAVKHNVISSESPLVIEIYNEEDHYLVVKNNLQLRQQQLPSTGVGINNIKERYKKLTPLEAEFFVKDDMYFARIPLIHIK